MILGIISRLETSEEHTYNEKPFEEVTILVPVGTIKALDLNETVLVQNINPLLAQLSRFRE